jgi:translation initiation factor IF-3
MRRKRYNRSKPKIVDKKSFRVNERIAAREVMVIGEAGESYGVLSLVDALAKAKELELDLVEVSPLANPPVCRITDFGKLQYKESKKEQAVKAGQKKVDTKGVRLGYRTDKGDLFFKQTQVEKFLGKGHKVFIEMQLRGREKAMGDLAQQNLTNFLKSVTIPFKYEETIKRGPKGFSALIVAA